MPSPIQTSTVAYLYFTGSYGASSGTSTLFISGSENRTSGCMPLFMQAKNTVTGTLSLYLSSIAKTNSWESLGNQWGAYNISCSVGAPTFCQDWEYIPYYAGAATGTSALMTLFEKGVYRGYASGAMPLVISASGDGVIYNYLTLNLYAVNNDSANSGYITLASKGHEQIYSSVTLALDGAYPNSSGVITLACPAYEIATESLKLFVSGI